MTGIDLKPESVIISDGVLNQLATNESFSPADLHLLLDGRTGQTRIVTNDELEHIEFESVPEKQGGSPSDGETAPPTEAAAASSDVSEMHHNTMVSELQQLPRFDEAAGGGSPSRKTMSGYVLSALSSRTPGSASTVLPTGVSSPTTASSAKPDASISPAAIASAKAASAAGGGTEARRSAPGTGGPAPGSAQPGASDWMAVEILPGVTAIVPDPNSPAHTELKPPSAGAQDKGVGPDAPPAPARSGLIPSATKAGTTPPLNELQQQQKSGTASSIPSVSMLIRSIEFVYSFLSIAE